MRSCGAFGEVGERMSTIRILDKKWHMFELIYRAETIDMFGDKRFSTELGMKHANENYGVWRLLLRDNKVKNKRIGTSLVAQWLRICLPVQGTRLRALAREDPTCRGATKPMRHNYWARKPQLLSPRATTTEACTPRARAPQQEEPPQWEARGPQWRVAPACRN